MFECGFGGFRWDTRPSHFRCDKRYMRVCIPPLAFAQAALQLFHLFFQGKTQTTTTPRHAPTDRRRYHRRMQARDYDAIADLVKDRLRALAEGPGPSKNTGKTAFSDSQRASEPLGAQDATLRIIADSIWEALQNQGVSWVGFYRFCPGEPDDSAMTLGPSRDTPACSPIGLHGVCGQAFTTRSIRIVRDVAELGDAYVACDPRDRSEIVLPCAASDSTCWGVLDLDSHEVAAFDESDAIGLTNVLRAAGIGVCSNAG